MLQAPLDALPAETKQAYFPPWLVWLGIVLAVGGSLAFVLITPDGILTKADYVAAAVCHRIPSHSFFIEEHQLPLCQRCSGTFPGALTGLLVYWVIWRRRRSQGFPKWPMLIVFAAFVGMWGLDGFNSYTTMLLMRPQGLFGYAPQPWIRLLTGVLMGSAMSSILVPAFNQTLWADGEDRRALRSWSELAFLIVVELAVAGLIYLLQPWLLYPVALYSALGVITMFVTLGAMIFVMATRNDQALHGWREAWLPLIWGLVFALAVVGGMDFIRYTLVGTLDGVPGVS